MEKEGFKSSRAVEEELRRYKYATFDRMIDLALDGVVTLDQAIKGFEEEIADDTIEEAGV